MNKQTNQQTDHFEAAMRDLGYRNFRQERGRYCLQVLNDLKRAYLAGWRNGYAAEKDHA